MPANLVNHNKKLTATLKAHHLQTSSQPTQQSASTDMPIHTPMEALDLLLARNIILEQQCITFDNLSTMLLYIAEAQKIPKTLEESIHSISIWIDGSVVIVE